MSLFRKRKMQRISSPDQMNDVIRVTTPAVWIILLVIVVLLVAILIWSIFGTIMMHDDNGNIRKIHPITYVTN